MKNTHYLAAWLAGEISDQDLLKIEDEAAVARYVQIKKASARLSLAVPQQLDWGVFSKTLPPKKSAKVISLKWIYSMAASFVLLLGISGFLFSEKQYAAQNTFAEVKLSDGSTAKLAPGAKLTHLRTFGLLNRTLSMTGEVFYQVEKGKPFIVNAPNGVVEVVGTAFKVLDSGTFFEVVCTEGKVKVTHQNQTYLLTKGRSFNSLDQNIQEVDLNRFNTKATAYYTKAPLEYIIGLVENLYNLKIRLNSHKSHYFTGLIPLNDKEKALKSISLPFSFRIEKQQDDSLLLIENK